MSGGGTTIAVPSAGFSPATLLARIKTVDGTGSGLDADLLDGLHASSFVLATSAGWGNLRVAKAATFTVVAGDRGTTFDCTTGTYDAALTAAATLGAGFVFGVYNSGTGVITINPNGSETIRSPTGSATTLALIQGQGVLVMCDGTGFDVVANATIPTSGNNTGDVTLTAIGSTPNANGASLTGQALNLQPADASFGGVITTGTQTIAGAKTFSGITAVSNSGANFASPTANALQVTGAIYAKGYATYQDSSGYAAAYGRFSSGFPGAAIILQDTAGGANHPTFLQYQNSSGGALLTISTDQAAGTVTVSHTTEATSTSAAAEAVVGGLGVAKRSFLGTIGSTFKGNVLAGVQDATADTAGAVGEVTQGTNQTTYTNFTTTNTFQQLAVLTSLAPGRYRIVGTVTYYGNAATVAAIADATFAISTTTASAAGAVEGRSLGYITQPVTSSTHITTTIDTDINISAATSYYLNGKANFTGGNPQWVASITAYRLR